MKSHHLLRIFLLAFIAGIALSSVYSVNAFFLFIAALLAGIFVFVIEGKKRKVFFLAALLFLLGILRYQWELFPQKSPRHISRYNGKEVEIVGTVSQPVDVRITHQKVTLSVETLRFIQKHSRDDSPKKLVFGRVLMTAPLYPRFSVGDRLQVLGTLAAPQPLEQFPYDRYLARYQIFSLLSSKHIERIGSDPLPIYRAIPFLVKKRLQQIIENHLPEPEAGVFLAMFLGQRRRIDPEVLEAFQRTGISHIIAISGLHISLLLLITSSIFGLFMNRRLVFLAVTIFLVFYIVMIGAPPSAVRSAIFGWLGLLAFLFGRMRSPLNTLLLAAGIMLMFNPLLLRDDIGFQLSFLAVWGMMLFLKRWEKKGSDTSPFFRITGLIQVSLAAYLATAPLIAFAFHGISLIALVTNILVVPVVSFFLGSAFFALMLSLLFPSWSLIFLFFPLVVIIFIIRIAEFFSGFPFAWKEVPPFPGVLLIPYYLFLLFSFSLYGSRKITPQRT